jgi:hypothetical protein
MTIKSNAAAQIGDFDVILGEVANHMKAGLRMPSI